MKFKPPYTLFALWLALAIASLSALRAQEAPPAPPKEAPAPADQPAAREEEKPAAVEPTAEPAATATETKKADGELRELGADDDKGTPATKKKSGRKSRGIRIHSDGEPPFGDHSVSAGSKQEEAVSLFGNSTVDGEVSDAAVSIFGNTTVNGTAGDAAVSVFGTTTVNGTVHGEVVAVFGDVVLGPNAEVGDHVVVVFGKLVRSPGAKVKGGVEAIGSFGPFSDMTGFRQWVVKCLLWGRPLWVGEGLGWIWPIAFGFLVFYMFIALLFPRGIEKSAEILEQRPGGTILAALLTTLLTPVLIVLLCVTVVGIFLVPFLVVGLFFCTVFGKVAVHAWLGRRITSQFGDGPMKHVAVSVFFGGLIIMLLYLVPFLGFLLWKLFAVLGLGMIVFRLILSMQREKPARAVAAGTGAGGSVPPVLPGATYPAAAAPLPAVISASTLERAGFWRRIGATFLDFIMVGIILGMSEGLFHGIGFHPGRALPLWFAVYHVIMWATKGTTIGGIICGLKVVRTDDRPVDWSVALVRGLSAFLSLAVAGLGFIWVAFDDDKQSWHDKIAGTTIVRVPKGTPLV